MKHWFKFVVNPLSIIPILFVFHGYFPRVPREINRCFVWTRVSQSPRSLRGRDRWSYTIVRCKGRDVRNGIHSNHRVSRDNKEFFELTGILVSIRSARVYIYIRENSHVGKFVTPLPHNARKRENKTMACNYATRKSAWSSRTTSTEISRLRRLVVHVQRVKQLSPHDNILFALSRATITQIQDRRCQIREREEAWSERILIFYSKMHSFRVKRVSRSVGGTVRFNDRHEF